MFRRGKDGGKEEPRDFFEEHERRKAEKTRPAVDFSARSLQPPHSNNAIPVCPASSSARVVNVHAEDRVDAEESISAAGGAASLPGKSENSRDLGLNALISGLRSLGYEVKPLEALREYALQLDSETVKLSQEIEEKRKRLELLQQTRELLRKFGI